MNERKVAVVSGGSRGIGRAVAVKLAEDGYDIGFCYRSDENAAETLGKEIAAAGGRSFAVRADVADSAQVKAWLDATKAELGPIDAVITSAGITRDGALTLMSDEDWGAVLRTNLDGVFNVCRPAVFDMCKRRTGSVVTLSSVSGVYGNPTQANYSASKGGVIGFTKALAKEVGRFGVRVNAVAPGLIDTDMVAALAEPARKKLLSQIAMRRFGTPEEVAELVAFLVSDKAGYVTGTVMEIHGGLTI